MSLNLRHVSWKVILGTVTGITGTAVAAAITLRQYHLRTNDIFAAAQKQLLHAASVRELLGAEVVSTKGVVGGYVLPIMGTAVLTFPVNAENGASAIARVEAETEWLGVAEEERTLEQVRSMSPRWVLRHLEVDFPAARGDAGPLVLYSLPPRAPLAPWSPLREEEGSWMPRWLRDLVPVHAACRDPNMQKLFLGFCAIMAMHTGTYVYMRGPMARNRAIQMVRESLVLQEDKAGVPALREVAMNAAAIAARQQMPRGNERAVSFVVRSPLLGVVEPKSAIICTSLDQAKSAKLELLFKSTRESERDAWTLTHISVHDLEAIAQMFAQTDGDADDARDALRKLAKESPTLPLPTQKYKSPLRTTKRA